MSPSATNQALIVSGLGELALGALSGWPYALVVSDPERARELGIRSGARLRQWHLDLIALGGLSVLVGTAVPDLPLSVAVPLGIGAWTNANTFGVLVVRPELKDHAAYRAAAAASFAAVSWGFTALAALSAKRLRQSIRDRR